MMLLLVQLRYCSSYCYVLLARMYTSPQICDKRYVCNTAKSYIPGILLLPL